MTSKTLPRGIRNNNPGNIRLSAARWQGQKTFQLDPAFVEFETPEMGLRALMRVLLTYKIKYGLDSVESIINRYAPPHENATDSYIHAVAKHLGVKRRDVIDARDEKILTKLAQAITRHENGVPPKNAPRFWFDEDVFKFSATLALKG